jgi:anaerobic selenocysteine-containing dehydrogenase
MNQALRDIASTVRLGASACPHDCPSTCALEVEILDPRSIGRIRGAEDNDYTAGVVCAKVARYAERLHHKDRLLTPLRRKGGKGSGEFVPVSWDDALDITAEALLRAEARHGAQSVWPYYYAGTMGLVMRDGIHRLRHAKKYSGFHSTICVNPAYSGFAAGVGKVAGPDPREMAKSDLIVIWGTNAVSTQVNVMTHATRARKERGARIAAVDVYMNGTMEQADFPVLIRPGTDGALACAVMHCLFRADRDYLDRYTDVPRELEAHLRDRSPDWASRITSCDVATIEAFARLIGERKRAFFRLGYGFSRSRNGAANMHAASCIPAVTGAWLLEGGGAFHSNADIYRLDKTMIEGLDVVDPTVRLLDQSRIGAILEGDAEALAGGPKVAALFIQNTNPLSVAPDQERVKRGFAREDLFVCVHEQFMTETARAADIVLPATMFLEHDDFYRGGGHQYIILGPKLIEPPGECRNNHEVHCALAQRLGAVHPGFAMTPRELIDWTLRKSGRGTLAELETQRWIDCQPGFAAAHYTDGFSYPDHKFRFKPDWRNVPFRSPMRAGPVEAMPALPDHWEVIEEVDAAPSVPARHFAGTELPQFDVQRDADIDEAGAPPGGHDPSPGCRRGRHRGRGRRGARQCAWRSAPPCTHLRRRAARRADRGIDLAERRLSRRPRHQHLDRGRPDRALWRGCIPRQ